MASGLYTFTPDLAACVNSVSYNFIVNQSPVATITPIASPICAGANGGFIIQGTPNAIVTYEINSGPYQTINLDSSGTATVSIGNPTASTLILLISVNSPQGCITNYTSSAIIYVDAPIVLQPLPDMTVCGSYILPQLDQGNYYSAPGGTGIIIAAGTEITGTQTVYVYAQNSCSAQEESFLITVMPFTAPVIATANDNHSIYIDGVEIVQPLLLDSQVSGNYVYQWQLNGVPISGATGQTYIATAPGVYQVIVMSSSGCMGTSGDFEVFLSEIPAPLGDPSQTFGPGATLANVVVEGQNIQWYDGADRSTAANPLPLSTPLVDGTTYYASQSIDGHESPSRLAVTVEVTLSNQQFNSTVFQYEPNPVKDILSIKSALMINGVRVYDMLGQEVKSAMFNSDKIKIDLSDLSQGTYFIKVNSAKDESTLRILKL